MAVVNGYATLAEYKNWIRPGGTDTSTDSTDDTVIEAILEACSRYIDKETGGRTFYPRVETRYYDYPENIRRLDVDDDLLEVLSITNGDDTSVSTSDVIYMPANWYPKYAIKIKQSSTSYWQQSGDGDTEQVIDIQAFWGYHEFYSTRAWSTGSTINEGAEYGSSDTTLTVTSGTNFSAGQLIKIDSEILRITGVSTNDLTVVRGENGSTAAAHDDGSTVYIWQVEHDIRQACLMIANNMYKKRSGEGTSSVATITAAGVVITPQDVPSHAMDIINSYRRRH